MKEVTRAYYVVVKQIAKYIGIPCFTVFHFIASQILHFYQHQDKTFYQQEDYDSMKAQIIALFNNIAFLIKVCTFLGIMLLHA